MSDDWGEAYIEIYYPPPADEGRERELLDIVSRFGGVFYDRDRPDEHIKCVVAWFEFPTYEAAVKAVEAVRNERGEHIEGPGSW